ncbi:transmembrane protein 14C-like protein [Phycomyces nitens]|nr:transmembrane protein 14C-like protein [Phycomyces nitens]
MTDIYGYCYSTIIVLGGFMGYIKAGSQMSLLAGILFGAGAGVGAYKASQNPENVVIGLGVSLTLLLVMGMRFSKSGKFMPAGMVTLLSALMVLRYGSRLIQ